MTMRNFIVATLGILLLPSATATADPKREVNLVASGAGVRTGVVIGKVRNTDVAPAIANLPGVGMPNLKGQVLRFILQP